MYKYILEQLTAIFLARGFYKGSKITMGILIAIIMITVVWVAFIIGEEK